MSNTNTRILALAARLGVDIKELRAALAALPLDEARKRLFATMQAAAGADIDTTPPDDPAPGDNKPGAGKKLNVLNIYKHRAQARAGANNHA